MRNQKGQALVETALILPILLLLIMGLFEFGRIMYIKNTLNNAARAGVRTAVVTQGYDATTNLTGFSAESKLLDCSSFTGKNGPVYEMICGSITNGIPKTEVTADITFADLDVSGGISPSDSVNIKLTWNNFQFFTPLGALARLASGSDGSFTLNTLVGEASMRYE